jgi:RNA polymerase sigma-32 factor
MANAADIAAAEIQTKGAEIISIDPLQRYLLETKQHKLLTREEEVELARRVQEKNDEEALNQLISSNLRLVIKIAFDYHRHWKKDLSDLIQEGNLGLLQAARKYDPDRGIKFSYYASYWIKANMSKSILDNWRIVRIGTTQGQRKLFYNLAKERDKLIAQGFHPKPKLIAESLNVKEKEVVEMSQRLGQFDVSLNTEIDHDSRQTLETLIKDPSSSLEEQLSERERMTIFVENLKRFRKTLSAREADIFDNRIMAENPLVLEKLGQRHRISKERVRQIQTKIVARIRRWSEKEIPGFEEGYSDLLN